ncbi:hypothetical protein [Amycolatopsis sp. lyj-112]|uniref:hypothetical protein n=1 Tax=Amycolatopsis sp. lyj-112 TaxID=2789288 RepID=UPI00397ABAA5
MGNGAVCEGIGGTETLAVLEGTEGGGGGAGVTGGGGSSPEQAASRPTAKLTVSRRRHDPVVVETGKAILSSTGRGRPILTWPDAMP